jgi:hypothetical protein
VVKTDQLTKGQNKMTNITIKINFNGDSIEKRYETEISTHEILSDSKISNFLGFDPARVTTYIDGTEFNGRLTDGDIIDIVTKSSTKGSEFFLTCGVLASELSEKTGKSFFFHYFQLIETSI